MARERKIPDNDGGTEPTDPVIENSPIEIVDLESAIQQDTISPEQSENGVRFWFGEIGLIHFPDKTTYAANKRREFITDPELIEKLTKASQNPSHKIFIE